MMMMISGMWWVLIPPLKEILEYAIARVPHLRGKYRGYITSVGFSSCLSTYNTYQQYGVNFSDYVTIYNVPTVLM